MSEFMEFEMYERVAVLAMDDGKANAFGPAMIAALDAGLDQAVERDAGAVVIKGRAGVFCAGFDLNIIRGDDEAARAAMRDAGRRFLLRLYLHPQPVVIACTGHALAAGALMLLTADYRVGAEGNFKLGLNETAIGLSLPPYGLELARDRLSRLALSEAILGARIYRPAEAVEVGYLDRNVAPAAVVANALEVATRLSEYEETAYAITKQRLRAGTLRRIEAAEQA